MVISKYRERKIKQERQIRSAKKKGYKIIIVITSDLYSFCILLFSYFIYLYISFQFPLN